MGEPFIQVEATERSLIRQRRFPYADIWMTCRLAARVGTDLNRWPRLGGHVHVGAGLGRCVHGGRVHVGAGLDAASRHAASVSGVATRVNSRTAENGSSP
jgi:hypothetical protein